MTRFLALAAVVFLALTACAARMPLRTYYMPAGSMVPTIKVGGIVLVAQTAYAFAPPQDGDIVLFTPPIPTTDPFLKRVIAGPGERFRMEHGAVYVNGRRVKEPYIAEAADYSMVVRDYGIYVNEGSGYQRLDAAIANIPPRDKWNAPDRIPPDCYIALGDNRNDSEDTHIWGFAQYGGKFFTGSMAGKDVSIFGKVVKIF
jgi:signal peptidase I